MASETINIPSDQHLDYQMVAHILEGLKDQQKSIVKFNRKLKMHAELRMLTFWRAIISECLASFLFVFIVCGATTAAGVGSDISDKILFTSLASGLTIAALTHSFHNISGAHINPAVTIAHFFTRLITPLRTTMYVLAQLGGGIAGAALLRGCLSSGNLYNSIQTSSSQTWDQRLGVEVVLTFVIVFTYFVSTNSHRRIFGNSAVMIGAAYSACTLVYSPCLNPARALGPSFVLSKWENQWIYWFGPLAGGGIAGIFYEIIFSTKKRHFDRKDTEESSSMNSGDEIDYNIDVEKPNHMQPKFHGENYNTYRSAQGNHKQAVQQQNGCQTMYQNKVEREPIYGGTRSMYCKSPQLTRANLHRSQSVYTKSNSALNRENSVIRNGPLVPAQSLYPLRVAPTQQTHLQNQNVQNQLQQRTDSIYGIRSSMRQNERMPERPLVDREPSSFQPIYGARPNNPPTPNDTLNYESREEPVKYSSRRPDSTYGMTNRRIQSAQSDDSSYGSYHGSTPPSQPNFSPINGTVMGHQQLYGMLPLPNPPKHHHPNPQTSEQIHQHQQQQQPQQHKSCMTQKEQQIERKLSTSTTSSQIQRSVEFKEYQSKSSSSNHTSLSSLPPPPPPNQHYPTHSIRQN